MWTYQVWMDPGIVPPNSHHRQWVVVRSLQFTLGIRWSNPALNPVVLGGKDCMCHGQHMLSVVYNSHPVIFGSACNRNSDSPWTWLYDRRPSRNMSGLSPFWPWHSSPYIPILSLPAGDNSHINHHFHHRNVNIFGRLHIKLAVARKTWEAGGKLSSIGSP